MRTRDARTACCWDCRRSRLPPGSGGASGRGPAPLILCGLALAAAAFTHFYAVLMVLPLAAGEATRVFIRRRIDWAMWMVLGLAIGVPLLLLRPLVGAVRQFAATFWSGPTTEKLMALYRELPEPLALLLISPWHAWQSPSWCGRTAPATRTRSGCHVMRRQNRFAA